MRYSFSSGVRDSIATAMFRSASSRSSGCSTDRQTSKVAGLDGSSPNNSRNSGDQVNWLEIMSHCHAPALAARCVVANSVRA